MLKFNDTCIVCLLFYTVLNSQEFEKQFCATTMIFKYVKVRAMLHHVTLTLTYQKWRLNCSSCITKPDAAEEQSALENTFMNSQLPWPGKKKIPFDAAKRVFKHGLACTNLFRWFYDLGCCLWKPSRKQLSTISWGSLTRTDLKYHS